MAKFREFTTSSGKIVLGGKSAENNEHLIKQVEKEETYNGEKVLKKDIKEAAVFCAKYSQDWRDNKRDVAIHYFLGRDISKTKKMKLGTFGVKNAKKIIVKKGEIEKYEKTDVSHTH